MRSRLLPLMLILFSTATLFAQKSNLSTTLRGIAADDLHYPPDQMGQLITRGLANPDSDEREAALYAIAGRSGILMEQTPEKLAAWAANRSTLQTFRKQVQQIMLHDSDQFVREAAVMALAGLTMRPEKGEWVTELDDTDVAFLAGAFDGESFAGARTDILRLIIRCKQCSASSLDVRKQLVRVAAFDVTPAVVEQALYGVGTLKVSDMVDYAIGKLKDPNPVTRGTAARAIGLFGHEGIPYRDVLQDALSQEKTPEVRGMIEEALKNTE